MFDKEKVNLIILGEQHNFTSLELSVLAKNFRAIEFIKYKNFVLEEVIAEINFFIKDNKKIFIVLNTKEIVPKELLTHLSKKEDLDLSCFRVENFMEKYLKKCHISTVPVNMNFLENHETSSMGESFFKCLIDYSLAISIFLITLPVVLYTIFKIKKESPGAIFFKQDRVGLDRKIFSCYKFRSMHENSHHDPYTRENDSRIFPWGNIMRKTRIDEIPQLINVLKGDMHLIGPRAEWNILVDDYEKTIPYYHERHVVKPGITGWAQVNYPYGVNNEDTKQKLMYDLFYIRNWSLWLEIKTILKTVMVVLGKKGL